jgi:hypothetical protein
VGDTHGFAHGFLHPLSGIDHMLAMVAVGLFAAQLGGRALWLVPTTFVSVMALAGVAGMAGVKLPLVEIGIPTSRDFVPLRFLDAGRLSLGSVPSLPASKNQHTTGPRGSVDRAILL